MILPVTIKGETLGKTIYNVAVLVAIVCIVGYVGFVAISGRVWEWRAHRAENRADSAEATAKVAVKAATDSDGAAGNATLTRSRVDVVVSDIRSRSEEAAGRAVNYEGDVPTDGTLPDDLVRELDEATDRASGAANRLQRKGARRGNP